MDTHDVIKIVMRTVETTYGNLGFLSFRLHSIKPNTKENIFIIKYSFTPRGENKRIFYVGKVNIKKEDMFEVQEIKEEDLYR